ncbi:hypothetical protein PINS_up023711 [Pythium insidiosum]|nr:hypothetical protein PINS_up023711 [Pythium insidiosum]
MMRRCARVVASRRTQPSSTRSAVVSALFLRDNDALVRRHATAASTAAAVSTSASTAATRGHPSSTLVRSPSKSFYSKSPAASTRPRPRPQPRTRVQHDDRTAMATAVDLASSYDAALQAVERLRQRRVALPERVYLSLMEKANLEHRYAAVSAHFAQFQDDLRAGVVALPRVSDSRRPSLTSERVQMHRHVLWALFQGPSTTRYRRMQAFFRRHVQGKHNAMHILEPDALNFLLRVECTMRFVTALQFSKDGDSAAAARYLECRCDCGARGGCGGGRGRRCGRCCWRRLVARARRGHSLGAARASVLHVVLELARAVPPAHAPPGRRARWSPARSIARRRGRRAG